MTEETLPARRGLRRYRSPISSDATLCTGPLGYHNAILWVDEVALTMRADGTVVIPPERFEHDRRWPSTCAACRYTFQPDDARQVYYGPTSPALRAAS